MQIAQSLRQLNQALIGVNGWLTIMRLTRSTKRLRKCTRPIVEIGSYEGKIQ